MAETQNQEQQKERRWYSLSVPKEVMSLLRQIKGKSGQNKANWRIIVEALSFYNSVMSSPRKLMKVDNVEKASWYITKLSLAYSNFALNPNQGTYANFKEVCEEIAVRLGIDTSVLLRLADEYSALKDEEKRKQKRIEFNQAVKMLVKEIILNVGGNEND